MEARAPFYAHMNFKFSKNEIFNSQEIVPENAGVDSIAAGSWVSWVEKEEATGGKVVVMGCFTKGGTCVFFLGGGFKYFLFSQFDYYFSDGLKPPTSFNLSLFYYRLKFCFSTVPLCWNSSPIWYIIDIANYYYFGVFVTNMSPMILFV